MQKHTWQPLKTDLIEKICQASQVSRICNKVTYLRTHIEYQLSKTSYCIFYVYSMFRQLRNIAFSKKKTETKTTVTRSYLNFRFCHNKWLQYLITSKSHTLQVPGKISNYDEAISSNQKAPYYKTVYSLLPKLTEFILSRTLDIHVSNLNTKKRLDTCGSL